MPKRKVDKTEQIELLRGGSVVSTLTGAFGKTIRETRLTAILGYLMALEPTIFLEKFGFKGTASSISLETSEENGRSDIRVETTKGIGVIEAKLGWQDPWKQSIEYKAKWRVLLTPYSPSEQEKKRKALYIRWEDIGKLLKKLRKSTNRGVKYVSEDIHKYLEANNMIKKEKPDEICTKEINESSSLRLFLKARLYGESYGKDRQLTQAGYFAPHFANKISRDYPGVHYGISYISKIERLEVIDSRKNLQQAIQSVRGKRWFKKHKTYIDATKKYWDWKKYPKRYLLFLGEPYLVFNPPVKKDRLQKGGRKGFLCTFDELFSAWQGGKLK